METVALLYEDYQKELAEDFKNTFLKRASDTDSSRSNDTVIDEVTDMLSTNIAVYTEKLLQRWGFSSGGEGGGGGDVTVTLDDLLKKYLSDNYVTIKGDQEVFGEKDFRKGIRIAGRRLYWDEGNDALVIEGAAYTTRWLSAKGVSPGGGGAGSGGAAAMYQLIDVSPNDTKDAVLGAEKDYVLTFDGSFWRGMPNKGGLSSKLFTALDKEGNEVNPDDENAEIYAIRANYSLWSVGFLSAKGISDGGTGGGGGGAVALYQLLDVEKNAGITGVAGATKGSVLTFNGDKWYADKPKTAAGISNLFTALDKDGNDVDLNDESKLSTITNIRANYALWSVDWISAKGKSSGGSGGGGGLINLVYGFESLGGTFDNNDNSATFNAFTINEIWKLASSGLTNVTVTGSGNAVTDVTKGSDGRSLTFTKGSTFATKSEFDALNTKFNDFLTGSDADDIINKWSELEVFLQGMKESDNLAVILQSKMDKTAFSKLFTALDASGNEVDPSDDTKTIASIRANFGFWGVDYISAKGVSKGSGGTGGASTLYQLVDVLANDTEDGVEGAAAGKALVFDGTHWRAGDAGLNESQLYSYLTANKYLTQSAADSRYVTSSRKVIAGTGLSGGGALTSDVTLSLGTSGVVAGTYTKVMVDAYGRVTSGTNLSSTDIPNLDWSKITTGKPTTLAGYGITDAYTKTEADGKYVTIATAQTVSGAKTFSATMKTSSVLPRTDANSALGGTANRWSNVYSVNGVFSQNVTAKLLSASESLQIGDAYLKWDAANNAVYVIKKDGTTPVGFYSTDWLSAKGVSISGVQTGTLADLNDVEITDPVNGQALKYDAASKKWVNGTIDSFNVNQMWAELKKADSSKVIDASHIPTSVLDGRWVTLSTNQTITGQKTFTQNILFSNNITGIRNTAGNLVFGAGNENIFCILNDYVGPVEAKNNQLVLGNDVGYWKKVTAGQYISKVATGVSPLIVSSNTLVNNLNADLLDGYHQSSFLRADGVNQYVTLSGGDGNTEGYRLVFEGTVTGGWSINSMTFLVNSRHAGTGMISIVFHTTNQESTSYVGSLNYYGSILDLGYTMWRLFYNTTTKKVRLFWRFYDYSDCKVSILNSRGLTTNISNKTWYTTIPSDSGSELPSYYNRSDTTGSLATSRTLWGQPFNGTANVSGNMTGVGSINMSGQLTSTVASGVAPFIVVSNTVVGNLNADMVDGLHENSFLRHRDTYGIDGYNTLWSQIGIRQYNSAKPDGMANPIYNYGAVISLPGETTRLDIWYNHTSSASDSPTNGIQYRSGFNDNKRPWRMLLDSVNYASYSDGRYVKKAGDTMTGDLTISGGHILYMSQTSPTSTQRIHLQGGSNDYGRIAFGATGSNAGWMEIASCDDGNEPIYVRQYTGVFTTVKNTLILLNTNGDTIMSDNKGLSVGWGSRQVRQNGSWVHGGADAANSDDANLRFGSWMGIGWYPTISGQTVAQGKNAMWLNTRTGVLNVVGGIKESTICIGRVNSSGGYDTAYNGEINRYDYHLFLQRHSGNHLIMCTGGGLAGIGTNSPGEKLHVAGNTRTDGYFKSTVGTGTAPYQCSSTTLNTNLNADMLDNWHLNFLPRNYNNARTYSVQFAIGGTDNNWKKIFACSESGAGPYRSVTVWGQIWYAYGNHAQEEVRYYHFCAIFQMRTGPSASDSNVGNVSNSARLYLPTFAKGIDNIRLVRVGTNNFELQVRQIYSYHNGHIQYQYWATGANVSAWENLQLTSNTSVAVSAGGASTLADSRASSADVLTTSRTLWGRPFNGSANIDGNIDNAAVITSKGGIWLDLKGSSGVAFYTKGSLCAVMTTTGVGIGTISPSQKLHVVGNIIATGAITAKASSSDIRLKTDIQGYDAMGIIRKFRSVKYHWNAIAKENSEVFNHDNWNYGLIAQDLLSGGYTQWVKDIFNDYYTIDYERLIPVVWKGLQEVDDEVTKLKREVARLNKRVKELEKSLCA